MRTSIGNVVGPAVAASCLLLGGCETAQVEREACSEGDTATIQSETSRSAGLDAFYSIEHCATRKIEGDVELACLLTALEQEIKLPIRWERQLTTFVPPIVTQMAENEDLAVATLYERDGVQLYADGNLTRAVLYKPLASCASS